MLQKVHDKDGREPVDCDQLKALFHYFTERGSGGRETDDTAQRRWMSQGIFKILQLIILC